MMDRRAFVAGTMALLATPLDGEAQYKAGKVPRIAYLSAVSAETDKSRVAAFRQGAA